MPSRALLAALLLATLTVAPSAQEGLAPIRGAASSLDPAQGALTAPGLRVHHGFPLAGGELTLVVDGLEPGGPVQVRLVDALAAPPSLLTLPLLLVEVAAKEADRVAVGLADGFGRLVLRVPLQHPEDPGHLIKLEFTDLTSGAQGEAKLLVQPPMALVPTASGLARVELLNGMPLTPPVPLDGNVLGAALSTDGLRLHALLAGGRLEERSAHSWNGPLLGERIVDPAGDDLASSAHTGPVFVVVRPEGGGFAPRGRLVSLDEGLPVLEVDPLGRQVSGRRWALTDDGLTAFVAEDDLVVREIDLLTWTARTPFTAGYNGDETVADLTLVDDRLFVISRRSGGRPGSLTVLDLTTGSVTPHALAIDPIRVVGAPDGTVLVLPAEGGLVQVVERGTPTRLDVAGAAAERVLDGAPVSGGVLLLLSGVGGSRRLAMWSGSLGVQPLPVEGPIPAVAALASAGHDLALLLGAPGGRLYRVVPSRGLIEVVEGVTTRPEAARLQLP